MKLTKKGARDVTRVMERLATVLEQEYATLGLPGHIAMDAARRFDLLSDAIERHAGLDPQNLQAKQAMDKEADFNAGTIGELKSGPLEQVDSDEPYMSGEFTQQEKSELREKQEAGDLSDGVADVKVAFTKLVGSLKGTKMSDKQAATIEKALRLATSVILTAKAEEDEPEEDTEEPEEKEAKKASHGFNLDR